MSTIAQRIKSSSLLSGEFELRSGATSNQYFDKYQFESMPTLLLDIAQRMADLVPPGTEVLAGLEMGGIPVVTMLSQVTGIPASFIRKEPKKYGTCRYAEGAALEGKRFVLVEDVVSSGGAILDAASKLESDGLAPAAVLCVIDRETGGREALEREGLSLRSLLTASQLDDA
jgi:orotate phosphoribosyltransferase